MSDGEGFRLEEVYVFAENDDWQFAVGMLAGSDRWLGLGMESDFSRRARQAFASEGLEVDQGYLHIFAEVSEGLDLGLPDRDRAILLTGACAQDPESCFGGINTWHVPPELRGDPEAFRCHVCGRVGCNPDTCAEEADYDYGDEDLEEWG